MVQKSLKKNAVYSFVKSLMGLLFPLISFPYASRVLLPAGIGKVNFANSIIEYFTLAASLGIFSYAAREAVRVRDNQHELNKIFKEILTINLISTFVSYLLLFLSFFVISKFNEYRVLLIVCSTKVLFTTIGVDWIFNVQEEYKYITIRSVIFQILSLVLLFILVRGPEDYVAYAFMGVFSSVGSNVCNIFYSRKFVNFFEKCKLDLKRHIKPIFVFFGMHVATKIHTALDSIMLGFLLNDSAVGYYSAANKIKGLVVGLLTAIQATFSPRASYYVAGNKVEEYNALISKTLNLNLFFTFPATLGVMLVAKPLILLFSGSDFLAALPSMLIMSPVIIFTGLASFADNMILLPKKLERISLYTQILACFVNIGLNACLIPVWGVFGASFATFVTEGLVTVWKMAVSVKFLKQNTFIKNFLITLFSTILMGASVIAVLYFTENVFIQLVLGFFTGASVYAVLTLLMGHETALMLVATIKKRIKRNR